MFKVMLVDDEPLILEGLKHFINWEREGFTIIHKCKNGLEAYRAFQKQPVDLVITDIQMPEMTGLELLEKIQAQTISVVLSGYQDFGYIRTGLKLGIENYLLKPIDEEELIETLRAVRAKLELQQKETLSDLIMRDHCISRWFMGQMKSGEFEERMQFYPDFKLDAGDRIGYLRIDWDQTTTMDAAKLQRELEQATGAWIVYLQSGQILVIWPKETWLNENENREQNGFERLKQHLAIQLRGIDYVLVYSNPIDDLTQLKETYRELEMATELKLVLPEQDFKYAASIYFGNAGVKEGTGKHKAIAYQNLIDLLTKGQVQQVRETLRVTVDEYMANGGTLLVKSTLLELCMHLRNHFYHTFQYENYVLMMQRILMIENQDDTYNCINMCLDLVSSKEASGASHYCSIIQAVVKYIHLNYAQDMSLKTLGAHFYMNPIYLGQLFQKEVKTSFTNYLNQVRIEQAKLLLLSSHEKAGRIGKQVGYPDPAYFYKQFKRYEKITPNEWRKQEKCL